MVMLNWLHDPMPALKEMHRVLEVDGLVMFSTLGPDTLKELRAALPTTSGERVHRRNRPEQLPVNERWRSTVTAPSLERLIVVAAVAGALVAIVAVDRRPVLAVIEGVAGFGSVAEQTVVTDAVIGDVLARPGGLVAGIHRAADTVVHIRRALS